MGQDLNKKLIEKEMRMALTHLKRSQNLNHKERCKLKLYWHKTICPESHNSIIPNSQKLETSTCPSTGERMHALQSTAAHSAALLNSRRELTPAQAAPWTSLTNSTHPVKAAGHKRTRTVIHLCRVLEKAKLISGEGNEESGWVGRKQSRFGDSWRRAWGQLLGDTNTVSWLGCALT